MVLFLHGAGGVPQWLPFFDALAERYELLVHEHPGFGGSADPPWIRSMADLAARYQELLGVDHFIMRCQWPGLPQEQVLNSIQRLGEIFAS
jgi:pimeloyl-ACP methyl ester carboxylesterase